MRNKLNVNISTSTHLQVCEYFLVKLSLKSFFSLLYPTMTLPKEEVIETSKFDLITKKEQKIKEKNFSSLFKEDEKKTYFSNDLSYFF